MTEYPQTHLLQSEMGTAHADRGVALDKWRASMICVRQAIEGCLPYTVARPNGTRYKRHARLAWLSYVTGEDITSGTELTNGQNWRISYWFEGLQPRTGEEMGDAEDLAQQRTDEVFAWLMENHEVIMRALALARSTMIGGHSSTK